MALFLESVKMEMCVCSAWPVAHSQHTTLHPLMSTSQIADFGMSRDLADETYYISRGGKIPVKWTAPEVKSDTPNHTFIILFFQALHYKKYSTASDVWSFGCLMYEIWSLGHKPFEKNSNAEVHACQEDCNKFT